jgi:tRNA(fMet)-specific endonuclease VapC
MSGNLIDTNVIVKIFRGDNDVEQILDNIESEKIFISVISVGELYYGAFKSNKVESNIAAINEFISFYKVLEIDKEISFYYGEVKNKVFKAGFTGIRI